MEYIKLIGSPLGRITLASDGSALTGLWFSGQRFDRETLADVFLERDLPIFEEAVRWLNCYFAGRDPGVFQPVSPKGSEFRRAVWKMLEAIPYGETVTYGEIAGRIARIEGRTLPAARAVGGAVSHNPISLIIPCHRVIGSDGRLTGYAAGVDRKETLLKLEKGIRPG
ncbi:MAG: methylated-DNA--[protein]-cysteine S-methyltransferase [Clostridia bacterium]|nr:methylated-DNA--[protein]-cysteine S-methyltransferase [Clostridia bacterium]